MSNWSAGYVSDIGYTFGYYNELDPVRARLAFLNAGLRYPKVETACELGFGQGMSANIHAAGSEVRWFGTDFNPSQADFARELAAESGAEAFLFDDAFADFANRQDLPEFDFIGLHGIWSWVSDENRKTIVDFIRRKLKVGGVLYISYNTLPGWSTFAPMRHLMTLHSEVIGAEGHGIVSRIDGAINFAEQLLSTNPIFARVNPGVAERMKSLKDQNRHYLAHEYFNRDWHPMHFANMANWLEPAKVNFACSAAFLDHIDIVNLTAEQQKFLADIPDFMLRQSVRDFMVNQQFRRDYWVKGARRLTPIEQYEGLKEQRVILQSDPADVSLKFNGSLGEVTLTEGIYKPIIEALSDHKVKSVGNLETSLKPTGTTFAQLVQALMVLASSGHVSPAQEESRIGRCKKKTDKLNLALMHKARGSGDINFLASPVTGAGVQLGHLQQIFLLSFKQDKKKSEEMANFVWQCIQPTGQKMLKNGKPLDTPEENLAELNLLSKTFTEKQLPILKALQIA